MTKKAGDRNPHSLAANFTRNVSDELLRANLLPFDLMRKVYTPEITAALKTAISNTPGMTLEIAARYLGVSLAKLNHKIQGK